MRTTMRVALVTLVALTTLVGAKCAWAGVGVIWGGTVMEPGVPRPGVDRDFYRLKDDVFLTRGSKGFDAVHNGAGFDPRRGLAEFEHIYVRELKRPYFFVLDGKLSTAGETMKPGNRHRLSFHNLGLRDFEAFSPNSPALNPSNAAAVFYLYTYAPPVFDPKRHDNNFMYQIRHVCRVEFKEGKALRGWTAPVQKDDGPVTTLDVGGLALSNSTVTGTLALAGGAERYEIEMEFKGAIVAGAFKTPDDTMKGGILGDLNWGHAVLNAKPLFEIMLGHALGGDPTGKDDLVVTLTASGGKVEDVGARMFAGDRTVKVLEHQMQMAGLDIPFGALTVQVGETKYHVTINKGIRSYVTGLLGDTSINFIIARVRRDGPNGELIKVEGRPENYSAVALVRNAWLGRLPKAASDQVKENGK